MSMNRPLVPCGRAYECNGDNGTQPCTLCHLLVLLNNIYNLLLSLLIIVALLMITIGGVMYIISAGNPNLRSIAKKILVRTLTGFAIFLLSWLIVYTTLVFISANQSQLGTGANWWEFTCSTAVSAPSALPGGPTTPASGDEAAVRQRLSDADISIWESSPGATEVGGLREDTIQGVIDFRNQVGTNIILTAGSEAGPHATSTYSHANGYKVDIEDTAAVNNYIQTNYTYIGQRSDGAAMYNDGSGNIYARESTHWDVCYNCS
jgi:hypothetical protein